jgi:hypothetical protein
MLTRILHNSERLCAFFDQLEISLYKLQHQHILNMADALLVCEDKKTLAALQRQFVQAPDASNMGCVPPFTHGVSPRPVRLMKPGVIRAVPDVRFHASSEPPCR